MDWTFTHWGVAIALLLLLGGTGFRIRMIWGDPDLLHFLVLIFAVGVICSMFACWSPVIAIQRLPNRRSACGWGLACGGTAVATMLTLMTSFEVFASNDARPTIILLAMEWTTLAFSWLGHGMGLSFCAQPESGISLKRPPDWLSSAA